MARLTKKDKKILYELDLNSRASLSQLARKVALSKQVVDYRLKNLVKNNIIRQFYTIVNFSKLGYTQHKLYFKFQNVSLQKEKEMIDYWIKDKTSIWIGSCRGRWDLAVSILAKDINDFGEILNKFINKYSHNILEKNILITQISPVFTRAYLAGRKEKKKFVYSGKIGHYELDDVENKILTALSNNARINIVDLMKTTGLSRDVISYRMRKLKKDNIISQYRVLIDIDKIKHKLYKIMLRLHSLTPEKEKEFVSYVALHIHGTQYLKLAGSWDCELEFEVKDDEQLHKILLEIRNKFSDIIRDYDTLLIHEEHKLNYYPF